VHTEEAEMSTIEVDPRELAFRTRNGLEVALLWWRDDDRLAVAVVDHTSGGAFVVPVEDEHPLDVYEHPFAHAARRGIL
jgi:hypothetical protein